MTTAKTYADAGLLWEVSRHGNRLLVHRYSLLNRRHMGRPILHPVLSWREAVHTVRVEGVPNAAAVEHAVG
jgi:hypothetical protein